MDLRTTNMPPTIRLATPDDAPGVLDIYAPIVRDTSISFELEPPSVDEVRTRIETTLATYPWIVCEIDGSMAGYAYASRFRARAAYDWSAEVTVYVHEAHRKRRVGVGLYAALLDMMRSQGFRMAIAGVTIPNEASMRLHTRMGFTSVGVFERCGRKFNAWHAVAFLDLDLGDAGEPVPSIKSMVEMRGSLAWADAMKLGAEKIRP